MRLSRDLAFIALTAIMAVGLPATIRGEPAVAPRDYRALFGRGYDEALARAKAVGDILASSTELAGDGPRRELTAVVFPELLRFSTLRDKFETTALELVYVRFGSSDFSIGPLQMKPSFAERIELWLGSDPGLSRLFPDLAVGTDQGGNGARAERLRRLSRLDFQCRYLVAFYRICAIRFPALSGLGSIERLAFLASAYNCGFFLPRERIEAMRDFRAYPAPPGESGPLSYVDICLSYFMRTAP